MVLISASHHVIKKYNKNKDSTPAKYLIYVRIFDYILVVIALGLYFKCNFSKGVTRSLGKKVGDFFLACCCHLVYIIYNLVVPC